MRRNQHGDWKYKLQLFKGNHTLYYMVSDAEVCWGHLEGFGAKSTVAQEDGAKEKERDSKAVLIRMLIQHYSSKKC